MTKAAFVTGGARGIGLGISMQLAKEGMRVAVMGTRPEEDVQTPLQQIRDEGAAEVLYCQGDVGATKDRDNAVARIREHFGELHCLVNNAGVAPKVRADILEATEESYERVMRINLQGPHFLTQAVANWMIEQKEVDPNFEGCIINVGSISATVISPSRGEYCLSKAGMAMMTELWAARMADYNIPVYEIRPGLIQTDMTSKVREKYDKLIADGLCLTKRWGFPEDIGKAARVLVTGELPYSTGQVIMVDGGLTRQVL